MKDIFKPVDNFHYPEVLEISVIINNCKHSIKIDKEDCIIPVLDSEDIDKAIQFLFELKPKLSF